VPVLALNLHAGFKCRHSGACCMAGWPIPVEPSVASAIRADHGLPAASLRTDGWLPDGAEAVITPLAGGACPFFENDGSRLCTIHRRLGHATLPASCRHFPRVTLLEPDAVRVTLSHFCPTVASMLFRDDIGRLGVVPDAEGIADRDEHDGFDARQTIPPLLRPGIAADQGTCNAWENYLLSALDVDGLLPEDALAGIASTAEIIRGWTAGRTTLEAHAVQTVAASTQNPCSSVRWTMTLESATRLFDLAAESVTPGLKRPVVPACGGIADRARVSPRWAQHARPIRRYLAARSFGAWSAYLGEGLRTQVAMLSVALAAVRVEAIRETSRASQPLDAPLLHAAFRSADLLLHHLSDAAVLVRRLASVEQGPFPAALAFMGLEATP